MKEENEVTKEREACAAIAEDVLKEISDAPPDVRAKMNHAMLAARDIASRIKARGKNDNNRK